MLRLLALHGKRRDTPIGPLHLPLIPPHPTPHTLTLRSLILLPQIPNLITLIPTTQYLILHLLRRTPDRRRLSHPIPTFNN